MSTPGKTTKHSRIQSEIATACQELGVEVIQEYRGTDWRADIFVPNFGRPIAIEIQLSPQSLNKTLERQSKYIRDGIIGCWLFEKPVSKLNKERPDLPLFYVEDSSDSNLLVNLGDRRKVHLNYFLDSFISNKIRFQTKAKTKRIQDVKIVFYEMDCWKCGAQNNLYYIETPFYSSCHAEIKPEEALWESNSVEYIPELMVAARNFIESRKDLGLKLGQIKTRNSKTVGHSYTSFGCYHCDSIFGDFYVMEAKLEMMYEPQKIFFHEKVEINEVFELPIPHWCLPDDNQFCNTGPGHK